MLEELKTTRTELEQQYANLSAAEWVSSELKRIKIQYDLLGDIISKLEKEGEQNAPVTSPEGRETPSPNNDQ